MEHRYVERTPLRVNVVIYRQGLPVQCGWTRDLSMEGVFVVTSGLSCRRYEPLDLEFLPSGPNTERFRLRGTVVRSEPGGLAFEFDVVSETAFGALRRCIAAERLGDGELAVKTRGVAAS
jgi:hypothetical protein